MAALLPVLLLALAASPAPRADGAVRAADVAMDRAVARRDAAAFAALLEDDVIFASARRLSRGPAAVLAAWRPFLSAGGPRLRWAPARAGVASSRDLAFTTGRWTLTAKGKDGRPVRARGEYVTVWRRGPGGWRVLLDASLEPPGKLGEGLARAPIVSAVSSAGDLDAVLGSWTRGVDEGAYLVVRRRTAAGAWQVAVESAFPFEKPAIAPAQ